MRRCAGGSHRPQRRGADIYGGGVWRCSVERLSGRPCGAEHLVPDREGCCGQCFAARQFGQGELTGDILMTVGGLKHLTYAQAAVDPGFCKYILLQQPDAGSLEGFRQYLLQQQQAEAGAESAQCAGVRCAVEAQTSDAFDEMIDRREVQRCGHCGAPTIRNGGCATMHCTQCGHRWQWGDGPSTGIGLREERRSVAQSPATSEDSGQEAQGGAECCICLEAPARVVMLPCAHMCLCTGCPVPGDRCPICRQVRVCEAKPTMPHMNDSPRVSLCVVTNAVGLASLGRQPWRSPPAAPTLLS